jgi:probable O-glycosylation ligase (exosortase A-associated)
VKQLIFISALTLVGMVGAFTVEPFVGVAVYYLFAVLRPQYLWKWAQLPEVGWSAYVAWATIAATAWWLASSDTPRLQDGNPRFSFAHKAFFAFGAWICLTYTTSQNQDVAWPWLLEYLKLFVMFGVAGLVINRVQQIWWVYLATTIAILYIAYEMNMSYLSGGRADYIYNNGYGGLDNNGAGLMIAMGVPLAIYAWEGCQKWWRWGFIAGVPVLLHAVLLSYSRGAMLSLIAVVPVLIFRSRRRMQFALVFLALASTVPYLAGKEIRARFFSVDDYETDASANTRFASWNAAIRIAHDYPLFGVGIRNSNLFSYKYGADIEGRAIHSQYLQTLADTGYPGLTLYLLALTSTWIAIGSTRRMLKKSTVADAPLARSMLTGIEGSLVVFCCGAVFLSLEVFELPYIVALLAAQLSLLMRVRTSAAPAPVAEDAFVVAGAA